MDGKKLIAYPPGRKCERYDIPETVEVVGSYAFEGAPVKVIFAHSGVTDFEKDAASGTEDSDPFTAHYHPEYTSKLGKPIYIGSPDDLSKKQRRRSKNGFQFAAKIGMPEIEPWKYAWYML